MTVAGPTFRQIKAQASAIPEKSRRGKAVGIRSSLPWTGAAREQDGDRPYAIYQCDSPLALRMALRQPCGEETTKVVITPLDDAHLSDDILLRLAKRKLYPIDSWQIALGLFQAQALDPRLARPGQEWIADALLEWAPAAGYPAARGGFLDAEAVWPLLLRQAIGLADDTLDLTTLLRWSIDVNATRRFQRCDERLQDGTIEWLAERIGPVAGLVLRGIRRWERPDAVPLGLAAGVVFHPTARGKLEKAAGKLEERFLGGETADAGLTSRWSAAATEVVRALRHTEPKAHRQVLQRADEILQDVQAEAFAHLSDTSLLGFDRRLARFGIALGDMAARGAWTDLGTLQPARDAVRSHDQAAREARRLERVEMALRLVRWLGSAGPDVSPGPRSFAEAAGNHLRQGGFVDWARLGLRAGDPVRELSEAYAGLFEAVTAVREQEARQFGHLLADWTAAGSHGDAVVPVERILERIIAPLADERPVLVIVVDGMSVAVCRELLADLTRHEWVALCEAGRTENRPGVATIPSVTEYSRTSLWCGRLQQGAAVDEAAGFAAHPALLARCRSGFPPVLFHKVALQEAGDAVLAAEVRKEIASAHRKIVGVVINAVDDHLLKGDQIDVRWSRDEIKVLPTLLHEARGARRLVVLLSDHGHVLDGQTKARPGDCGERWRTAQGEPAADERRVQGPRVLCAGNRLIAPWSERVRYGIKKNGYHGGVSPQEMIVPIVVLAGTDEVPKGWQEQPLDTPAWWDELLSASPVPEPPVPRLKPAKAKPKDTLFDLDAEDEGSTPSPTTVPAETAPEWITRLIQSPVFEQQKQLAGRGLEHEVVRKFLIVLDGRGRKMTMVALARALVLPELRLPGLVAKLQRLLNVDGYGVLIRDDPSQTIELNRDLLLKQFDLV